MWIGSAERSKSGQKIYLLSSPMVLNDKSKPWGSKKETLDGRVDYERSTRGA